MSLDKDIDVSALFMGFICLNNWKNPGPDF